MRKKDLTYTHGQRVKVILWDFPHTQVKRGLEKQYRRIEKEVSEEVQRVVWGGMQESFMEQFKRFEELIEKCYPGSNITLEFTIKDLVEYFTTISSAQQK